MHITLQTELLVGAQLRGQQRVTEVSEPRLRAALDATSWLNQPVVVEVGANAGALAIALATARPDASVYALLELPASLYGRVDVFLPSVPYAPPDVSRASGTMLPGLRGQCGTGKDGLGLVRGAAVTARDYLVPGGSLIVQLGSFQWYGFAQELTALGYEEIRIFRRAGGVVTARAVWR